MNTIQHIAFNCKDIREQEDFYTRHFGFRRARVFNRGAANEFVMLRLESTCLELFNSEAAADASAGGEQAVGFKHLAFEVPDIDAAVEKLHADGIETGQIHDCAAVLPGLRVCFFSDPDGNQIELMQGYQDELKQ